MALPIFLSMGSRGLRAFQVILLMPGDNACTVSASKITEQRATSVNESVNRMDQLHLALLEPKAHQDHAGEDDKEAEQFEQRQQFDPLYLSGEGKRHRSTGFHHFHERKGLQMPGGSTNDEVPPRQGRESRPKGNHKGDAIGGSEQEVQASHRAKDRAA